MNSVFVIGAARGIGRELVNRALKRGDITIAGVRSAKDLDTFGSQPNLLTVQIDISATESVNQAFDNIDIWLEGKPLKAVINCAAVCPFGAVEAQPEALLGETLNTNAVGASRVLRASLPRLRGHDGRVVLVSSLWGKVAGPLLSAYASSKHAIEAIADCARRETRNQDVHVIVVEPGVVRTDMVTSQVEGTRQAVAALTGDMSKYYSPIYQKYHEMIAKESSGGVSAEECAAAIEAATFAAKPKARYRVGKDSKLVTTLARLLPDSALDKMFAMMMK